MNDPDDEVLPVLFAFPIGEYENLPRVAADAEADRLAELLAPFRVVAEPWLTPPMQRGSDAVDLRLIAWRDARQPGDTIFYWVGHGVQDDEDVTLAHASSPRAVSQSAIFPERIARALIDRQARRMRSWSIVIVDACWSSEFVDRIYARIVSSGRGADQIGLLGVAGKRPIPLGTFTGMLDECLRYDFGGDGAVSVSRLLAALEARLPSSRVLTRELTGARLTRARPTAFAVPLDVREELDAAVRTRLPPAIWEQLSAAIPSASSWEMPWLFEGRDDPRARICRWLEQTDHGMLIVTGGAGAGKSALLGQILLHSLPSISEPLARADLIRLPDAALTPPPGVFQSVINLVGLSAADVVPRIARAANVPMPHEDTGDGPGEPVDAAWLLAALELSGKPLTLLFDGFDESREPDVLASTLLRPLAGLSGVRLLVGTRPAPASDFESSAHESEELIEALGHMQPLASSVLIRVEREDEAVRRYVTRRLDNACTSGIIAFGDDRDTAREIDRVARVVASKGRGFLFARLAVNELFADTALLDPDHDGALRQTLETGHRGLFERAVRRLEGKSEVFGAIMRALALAQGRGIPLLDGVWQKMGIALAEGRSVSQQDVSAFLDAAQPYVMMDVEEGQTVFRFAHRTYADYFVRGRDT